MSEMVEHVARAIIMRKARNAGAYSAWMDATPLDGFEGAADARLDARAAIEAMREPTEAMVGQGALEVVGAQFYSDDGKMGAEDVWRAMADAALND